MRLPNDLLVKLENIYGELKGSSIFKQRENLTNIYKQNGEKSQNLISSKLQAATYALTRMPATYTVLFSLLNELKQENLLSNINSVLDVGAGTGAGYFAVRETFVETNITLLEKDSFMYQILKELASGAELIKGDITEQLNLPKADLVLCSYVLNELTEKDRLLAVNNLCNLSNRYILLVDAGTPKNYENFMLIKKYLNGKGFNIVAPCACAACPLQNDYCQFYARVERTALLRQAKNGTLPYEDEKYFYMLIDNTKSANGNYEKSRVIRRPVVKNGCVELKVCCAKGVENKIISKSEKNYKQAKKVKINELL